MAADLRGVAGELRGMAAPARVEARLLAAFRIQAGQGALPVPGVRSVPFFGWVAAAVILLAAGLILAGSRQPAPPNRALPANMALASAEVPEIAESDDALYADDGFMAVPNAEQIGSGEDMDLVRVEVPGSAMLAMGIPVSADRAAELVEADVLLGPDGLARAVRFVN